MLADFTFLSNSSRIRLDLVIEEGIYSSVSLDEEPALVVRIDPGIERFADRLAELMVKDRSVNLVLPAKSLPGGFAGDYSSGPLTHTGLGMELVSRLPGFAAASLAEVVDIRDELSRSLARFRWAVAELAEHRAGGIDATESIWLSAVEPALQELDEAVAENRYLRRLTEHLMSPTDGIATIAGVAVGLSTLSGVPEMMAAGLSIALPAFRAGWDRRLGAERIMQHKLFFLYGVRHRLSSSARDR
jgi:hypothetical protein